MAAGRAGRALPAPDREVEGHRHRPRHGADGHRHAPGAGGLTGPASAEGSEVRPPAPGRPVNTLPAQVIVLAKEPVPGRVKTRLTPPFTHRQAAQLAEAALADTLAAVVRVAARHVLALDGTVGSWLPPCFDVVAQRGSGLDERIAAALEEAYDRLAAPLVLIGMDTPQVTPRLLESAIRPAGGGRHRCRPRAGR